MNKTLKICTLGDTTLPEYATAGSAGLDLTADIKTELTIQPGETILLPSGIKLEIPESYVGLMYPRSSLGTKQGLILANTVGVIDSDYRGEVKIPLKNTSSTPQIITPNQRIAQLIIQPYAKCNIELVKEVGSSERGEGGFGSTGK